MCIVNFDNVIDGWVIEGEVKYYKLFVLIYFLPALTFVIGIRQKVLGVINFENLTKLAIYVKI